MRNVNNKTLGLKNENQTIDLNSEEFEEDIKIQSSNHESYHTLDMMSIKIYTSDNIKFLTYKQ